MVDAEYESIPLLTASHIGQERVEEDLHTSSVLSNQMPIEFASSTSIPTANGSLSSGTSTKQGGDSQVRNDDLYCVRLSLFTD